MKRIIVFLLCFTVSSLCWAKVSVGDIPPSYLGKNKAGEKVDLENMRNKVVVVTFWATWCPYCIKEMQILEHIQRQVGKDKLEIVAVNFKESRRTYIRIKKELKDFKITLTHDRRGVISGRYEVTSLPHMFIIGKTGVVEHIHKGYGESMVPKLVRELNELLEQPAATRGENEGE